MGFGTSEASVKALGYETSRRPEHRTDKTAPDLGKVGGRMASGRTGVFAYRTEVDQEDFIGPPAVWSEVRIAFTAVRMVATSVWSWL